jgi:hypothetical protein
VEGGGGKECEELIEARSNIQRILTVQRIFCILNTFLLFQLWIECSCSAATVFQSHQILIKFIFIICFSFPCRPGGFRLLAPLKQFLRGTLADSSVDFNLSAHLRLADMRKQYESFSVPYISISLFCGISNSNTFFFVFMPIVLSATCVVL